MIEETSKEIFRKNRETKGFIGTSIIEHDVIVVMWENKESIKEIECEYKIVNEVTGRISLQ